MHVRSDAARPDTGKEPRAQILSRARRSSRSSTPTTPGKWRLKLEKQLACAVFAATPTSGWCSAGGRLMDEAGPAITEMTRSRGPQQGRCCRSPVHAEFRHSFSSAVVKREHVSRTSAPFDPQWDLAIDYDLWLRVAKFHQFDFVDEELVRYRTGHGNLSKRLRVRVDIALCPSCTAAESPYSADRGPCRSTVIADEGTLRRARLIQLYAALRASRSRRRFGGTCKRAAWRGRLATNDFAEGFWSSASSRVVRGLRAMKNRRETARRICSTVVERTKSVG